MLNRRWLMPKFERGNATPSARDKQLLPCVVSHASPDALKGPAFEASGLFAWVWPMNTLWRGGAGAPSWVEPGVRPRPVTKVSPPFCTSESTLLISRYHCGRSQMAPKFSSVQWNDEV